MRDVYQIVNDRIIAELEKGIVPWKQSWKGTGIPRNLVTKRPYHGINLWLLLSLQYDNNYFLSYDQATALGGKVKKGEKACPVVFWKRFEKEDEATKEIKYSYMLRYYNVFNISQCELPEKILEGAGIEESEDEPIHICEHIVENMPSKPTIQHKGDMPYYVPKDDLIVMPKVKSFSGSEAYFNTLFHELVHSTGHQSRLNRKELVENNAYGSDPYAQEELVAEMGACYLNMVAGILTPPLLTNNAAYLQSWIAKLKGDKRLILYASAAAQKAADYILNIIQEQAPEQHDTVGD
ncbi:MAG: DUF1738 domain-containing protein [Bacteroidia bacterium]|nr:DUF1738 domain-containing protein [Bacteroidia bacterium]